MKSARMMISGIGTPMSQSPSARISSLLIMGRSAVICAAMIFQRAWANLVALLSGSAISQSRTLNRDGHDLALFETFLRKG